jgi:hypothetical protein
MKKAAQTVIGTWRIIHMDGWDADYFDMEVPAHITIRKDLTGEFQFGLVQGQLDGRIESVDGSPDFDFSWSGCDENDPMTGRGWLQVNGDQTASHIFIHLGDDSALKAERQ